MYYECDPTFFPLFFRKSFMYYLEQHQKFSVQKAMDLTIPAKTRRKNQNERFEFSDQKIEIFDLQNGLKLAFRSNYTQPYFS